MDPIHPIVPHAPRISPVTSSPAVSRAQSQADERRRQSAEERRRRARDQRSADELPDGPAGPAGPADDDGHPHIDITA